MREFIITLYTVLIMLMFLIPGYLLRKFNKVDEKHLKTISTILIYVLGPCMIIDPFLQIKRDSTTIKYILIFALVTIIVQVVFMLILYLIFRKKFEESKYRMLTVGSVCGNVGFFGIPLVKAILPDYPIATTFASIYVFTMNILVFTLGSFCITNDKKFISFKKAFFNPTTISLIIAIVLFAFGFRFDRWDVEILNMMGDAVNLLSKTTTPICMLILGIRLGSIKFKSLFTKPMVYLNCLTKLIIFPLFAYLCVVFFPLPFEFKASILVLSAAPCAAVVLNFAEMYDTNQEIACHTVVLTTLLSIITIPLLMLII